MNKIQSKKRVIGIIAIVVAAVILLGILAAVGYYWLAVSAMFSRYYEPDLVIASSPDDQYELVAREYSCLGGSGAEIYIREPGQDKWYNSWKEKQIGTASGDDYYQPFSDEAYHVEWESDRVTIYYYRDLLVEDRNDRSTWKGIIVYELE